MGLIEINMVYWNQSRRLTMLRNRPCLSSTVIVHVLYPNCSKVTRPSTCSQMGSMRPVYLFAYSTAVILYTLWFCIETVFYCSNLGLHLNDFNFFRYR